MLKDPFGIFFLLIEKKKTTRSVVVDHGLLYRRMRNRIAYAFPQDISPNELCTIKLTALFVTRYGMGFRKALKKIAPTEFGFLELNHIGGLTALFVARYGKRIGWELMEEEVVKKNPLFSFLDPSDSGFPCYNMVVKVYSKVLFNFEQVYTTDIVFQRYFQCLQWDEEKDEPKDMDDLYSFVECVDSFAQMEDREFYHKMGNRENQLEF
ncbi:hypothetical protein Bca4012_028044 [Brassica carinata]